MTAPANGRVLKLRPGMNPNSSGHGVMFGSILFLPCAAVSAILTHVCLSPSLEEALKEYRQRASARRMRRGFIAAAWGLSWLGFSGIWTFAMSGMVGAVSPYLLGVLSAGASVAVSCLAYRVAGHAEIQALTLRAAKIGLLPLGFGVAVGLTSLSPGVNLTGLLEIVLTVLAYGYLTPFAVMLCGVATRLGGVLKSDKNVVWAGVAYVAGGLLSLMLPPYPWGGYNSAGFLFPIWGWLLPAFLTIYGLVRVDRQRRHENTEDPL